MKHKTIYAFEVVLFSFIIILKFLFLDKASYYTDIVNSLFWILSLVILYKLLGYQRDSNICKTNTVQITVISLLIYILVSYLCGLLMGFLKNPYSLNIFRIIKNIYPVLIMVICEELIRYMVAKKCPRKLLPYIILTILYILVDVLFAYNTNIDSNAKLFVFISYNCLSSLARNVLCSYLSYKVSLLPSLIYRLYFSLYIYILPIFPNLGYYIDSVLGVLLPYIIYLYVNKLVSKAEKEKPRPLKRIIWYVNLPIIFFLVFVVILVSGIFKYQIIAIGSGSMEPIYYRGDAVVFEKKKARFINEGDILVYKHEGKNITHRVVSKKEENGVLIFRTKGDNNKEAEDDFDIFEKDCMGVVKLKIKYIGWPSLWFQEWIK